MVVPNYPWDNNKANCLVLSEDVYYDNGLLFDIIGCLSVEGKHVQITIDKSEDGGFHAISPSNQGQDSSLISFLVLTSESKNSDDWIEFLCRKELSCNISHDEIIQRIKEVQ